MRPHHTLLTLAAAAGLLVLTGCTEVAPAEPKPGASAAAAKPSPAHDPDALRAAAGLPAAPKGPARQAFLDGLDAIDRDIVHGKGDKAVSRGIDTCGTVKNSPGDRTRQTDQVNKRWTSPTHPEGHGLAKAAKILDVAHAHLCPAF
ncbi:hypothetical protein ABZZ17_15120 [Streptomyces sp. NPDC006512]|uniref:hypothetical protein n=1 Tax=Streptomyces sp. NPDC006512 TaxID=3154307 RepID=UPI0033B45294